LGGQVSKVGRPTLGLMFGRIGTRHQKRLQPELVAHEERLPRAVLPTAHTDDAVVRRPAVLTAPLSDLVQFASTGCPIDPVERLHITARHANAIAIERRVRTRCRLKAARTVCNTRRVAGKGALVHAGPAAGTERPRTKASTAWRTSSGRNR